MERKNCVPHYFFHIMKNVKNAKNVHGMLIARKIIAKDP
jgi:hypothetical protein